MSGVRTFDASCFSVADAIAAKRGRTVSVCIPCRNEAATIGQLVSMLHSSLVSSDRGLVDELIVVDDNSTDDSAAIATAHGATVVSINTINDVFGEGHGKGNALWATLAVSTGGQREHGGNGGLCIVRRP